MSEGLGLSALSLNPLRGGEWVGNVLSLSFSPSDVSQEIHRRCLVGKKEGINIFLMACFTSTQSYLGFFFFFITKSFILVIGGPG